jgi:DNA-formamidopyrimidine glycosylase
MRKKKTEKPPPEGAEVKIIGEGLAKIVSGKELVCLVPLSGRYLKKSIAGYDPNPFLWPQKVVGVGVKGKFIYWIFENGTFLFNTLGMTGGWSSTIHKHSRLRFEFDDGSFAYFNDVRNFGTLKFVNGKKALIDKLKSLGPDMLSEDVTTEEFKDRLCLCPDFTLAEVLMHQGVVCGVGNYVKAEALYRAKLSPHRQVISLQDEDYENLCKAVKGVLHAAYNDHGASIRNYSQVDGTRGEATLDFKIYGQKTDPDGHLVERTPTKDGRITHWCPAVQI